MKKLTLKLIRGNRAKLEREALTLILACTPEADAKLDQLLNRLKKRGQLNAVPKRDAPAAR